MSLPQRKPTRLKEYNYSAEGAYFVTICTHKRKCILSTVGDDAHIVPQVYLTRCGEICNKHIKNINEKYSDVSVEKYVIMPNHIHMIIQIFGTMRASSPTKDISNIVKTFKTMVTKEMGESIWQRSFHDHIIRNEQDYCEIWKYINNNPSKWHEDVFCVL